MKIYKISNYNFEQRLISLKSKIAEKAQEIYELWQQDENGMDIELGYGGICQDIAEATCNIINDNGINCSTVEALIGDQHVWVVAWENDIAPHNAYHIDISPYVYETGSGYVWKKRPNIIIKSDDVNIHKAEDEIIRDILRA